MMPWIVLLFIGVFDWGFFARALISTQNAARVAALYASQQNAPTDSAGACAYALRELRSSPNISSSLSTCTSLPLIVTAQKVTGADGTFAASVTVRYQTQQLIPIPGLFPSQATIERVVQMKL